MPKIRPLSQAVIAAIAAGEIVERPAVVIKELIENSLDAGAKNIKILVEQGGIQRMVVSDDGEGMDETDLELAVQRHTTSKIFSPDDISKLDSYGFRGEALASIASVSRCILQSRTADNQTGFSITIDNGNIIDRSPVGMPVGTTIIVENLFQNVPARRKFLQQPAAELRRITEVVQAAALSRPDVNFYFAHQDKVLLSVPAAQTIEERAAAILGSDLAAHFLPITTNHGIFTLRGLVGAPQTARKTRQKQYLFVNNRPVLHPALMNVVKEVYGSKLEPTSHPIFILQMEISPQLIDVNIHPRKEQIKFMDEGQVIELTHKAIAEVLQDKDLTYTTQNTDSLYSSRIASVRTHNVLKEAVHAWQLTTQEQEPEILQVHDTYLVAQTPDGMLVIDQHAAHERILYEQYLEALAKKPELNTSTPLSRPTLFETTLAEAQSLTDHLDTLHHIGFEIEKFGPTTFRITAVPQLLSDRHMATLFRELLDDIQEQRPLKNVDHIAHRTIAYLSCRQAVKAGDPLTQKQRRELLEKLALTPNNITCPHGRPITILYSLKDLEKLFHRR